MESANSRKRQIIAVLAVLIVISVIVAGITIAKPKTEADNTTSTTNTTQTTTQTDASTTDTSIQQTATSYKDGTYSATGNYNSPGGAEKITISVTLKDGTVTDTSATKGATGGEAEYHQEDFIEAYKDLVVGKNIGSLKLSRVAGASLTTQGFNNAIEQIKSQAQS